MLGAQKVWDRYGPAVAQVVFQITYGYAEETVFESQCVCFRRPVSSA